MCLWIVVVHGFISISMVENTNAWKQTSTNLGVSENTASPNLLVFHYFRDWESDKAAIWGECTIFKHTHLIKHQQNTNMHLWSARGTPRINDGLVQAIQRGQFRKTSKNRLTLCIIFALKTWCAINHVLLGGSNPAKNISVNSEIENKQPNNRI